MAGKPNPLIANAELRARTRARMQVEEGGHTVADYSWRGSNPFGVMTPEMQKAEDDYFRRHPELDPKTGKRKTKVKEE